MVVKYSPQYFETIEDIFTFWNKFTGNTAYSSKLKKQLKETISIIKTNPFVFSDVVSAYYTSNRRVKYAVVLTNFKLFYEIVDEKHLTILFVRDNRRNPEELENLLFS